ncbi:MAG TPA: hypothetical protein PKM43_13850 [Verrucomicrobiota bacterium]|nr:hypothetical protein [Verrucomicrobiota bacterium]HRZ36813.1 hypothetical protein [Candidatus Paceibacterota bacterium]
MTESPLTDSVPQSSGHIATGWSSHRFGAYSPGLGSSAGDRAEPILRSDFAGNPKDPNYDPLSQQNHVYGLSFWMPYHGSGLEHVDTYWTRSLMGPISSPSVPEKTSRIVIRPAGFYGSTTIRLCVP